MPLQQLPQVRLEYLTHGHGPERVVFFHGFQASARIWRATQEALPADRYCSIAINHRGAGASDAPADESEYSIPIFAEDASALLSALEWDRFTLVGHSLGGATAAQLAVDHGDRVKGLILLDPADPDGRAPPGGAAAMDAFIDKRMAARREQMAAGAAGDAIDASGLGVDADTMAQLAADMRAALEARLRGSLRSMMTLAIGDRLSALAMPALLACGDADELIALSAMLATWAKLPKGSGLHVWHGIGHSPNLDCPDSVAALIQRFVEQTLPTSRGRA